MNAQTLHILCHYTKFVEQTIYIYDCPKLSIQEYPKCKKRSFVFNIQTGSAGPITTRYYALSIKVCQYNVSDAYKACTLSPSDTVRRASNDTVMSFMILMTTELWGVCLFVFC